MAAKKSFLFSILALIVLVAKIIHIRANLSAIASRLVHRWGASFFAQDLLLLSFLRFVLGSTIFQAKRSRGGLLRVAVLVLVWTFSIYTALVGFSAICFYVFNGSEIHYRNMDFAKDESARALLLSGLLSASVVLALTLGAAYLLQTPLWYIFGLPGDGAAMAFEKIRTRIKGNGAGVKYEAISQQNGGDETVDDYDQSRLARFLGRFKFVRIIKPFVPFLALGALVADLGLTAVRPQDGSLSFISLTAPILPFVDLDNSSPSLSSIKSVNGNTTNGVWESFTALVDPPKFDWLPPKKMTGFEDWYDGREHYNSQLDPLHFPTDQELREELREKLSGVEIKHVMLIMLESTRSDVFPIKKDGLIWNRFAETYEDGKMGDEAAKKLSTLTPVANYITGDYDDGFEHDNKTARGGLNFRNAHTSGTFTLKSTVGTLCGIYPLVADFNLEYKHHFYQPCLPHIFDTFNEIQKDSKFEGDWTTWPWNSVFMQTVTRNYDHTGGLFKALGYGKDKFISTEWLRNGKGKFGAVELENTNYFGFNEEPLMDYMVDAFKMAEEQKERVFLGHITSTSHHPYSMPKSENVTDLGYENKLKDFSHYMNAIGYDDRWLGKMLKMLDDQGVANETLVIIQGDHGLSIPENDILATYYNPNVGGDHVPFVLSHPGLPNLQIDTPVSTVQLLPTILDLLAETGSLSDLIMKPAQDLIKNSEASSLVRNPPAAVWAYNSTAKIPTVGNTRTHGQYQFTVMNPGRAMVGVRDARRPEYRLVVPVLSNIVWRFTDLSKDPVEKDPTINFNFEDFIGLVGKEHGQEAAKWADETAFVTRWWVEENAKRWRWGDYEE